MGAQAVRLSNADIDNALKNKDFEILFQPIFDLGNGALARVEAFVRWRHPQLGLLPPGAFISFFESQGRMSELTRYVLKQALADYLAWRGANGPGFSVNLALSDLADEAFASHFSVLLRDGRFPADLITLECPMPPVTMPVEVAASHFARLSSIGARLAIEVRGRANDFLRSIDPFPFDEIKTGGAAILRFARTVRGPGLSAISELLDIASNSNAAITAVGVEDQASLAALRSLGFAAAQGNHLGKVGPISVFEPARVNDVRSLLGLEPLSEEDLQALFRTEAPSLQQHPPVSGSSPSIEKQAKPEPVTDKDALVQRLAARLARRAEMKTGVEAEDAAISKAKQNVAKAAAIARLKRKAAAKSGAEAAPAAEEAGSLLAAEFAPSPDTAARRLQERLALEFGSAAGESEAPMGRANDDAFDDLDIAFVEEVGDEASQTLAADEESEATSAAEEESGEADAPDIVFEQPEAEAPPVAAAAAGGLMRASLAVGRAGAYFRPGTRIAAVEPLAPSDDRPHIDEAEPAPLASAPSADTDPASELGDLDIEAPAVGGQAAQAEAPARRSRVRRKKNFLTRKYRLMPTHFWPRAWKRAWMRRAAEAERRREEKADTRSAAE